MIYFIQDKLTLHIKIGFTDGDPKDRLYNLQTANAAGLILLCEATGDRDEEDRLHEKFSASLERGEWFRPTPDIILWMMGVANGAGVMKGIQRKEEEQAGFDALYEAEREGRFVY